MSFRDITGRTVVRVWVATVGLHVAILGTLWFQGLRQARRELRELDSIAAHARASPPNDSVMRMLRALIRDSLGITWQRRGSTIDVSMPPPMESAVAVMADSVGAQLSRAMGGLATLAIAVFFGPEIVLALLTVLWLLLRRRAATPVASN